MRLLYIKRYRNYVNPKRVAEDVDPYGLVRHFYAETIIIPPREFHSRLSKFLESKTFLQKGFGRRRQPKKAKKDPPEWEGQNFKN